jgi:large subunit ribosomal protein L18
VIDDSSSRTVASAATLSKGANKGGDSPYGGNVAAAKLVGKQIAERALEAGIKDVVFDRGGHRYHGRVKALAEAAREAGLRF